MASGGTDGVAGGVPLWRPESPSNDAFADQPERSAMYAAVGRKP